MKNKQEMLKMRLFQVLFVGTFYYRTEENAKIGKEGWLQITLMPNSL